MHLSKKAKLSKYDKHDTGLEDTTEFRLITILFMSSRIKAKVFETDTLSIFLSRMRQIFMDVKPND